MIFSCNLGILTRHYKNPMIMHYACPSIPVMWDCLCINPVSDPKGVGIFKGLEKDFACMYTNYVLWNVLKYCLETLVGIGCRAVSFFFLYYCLRLCKERWFTRTIKKKIICSLPIYGSFNMSAWYRYISENRLFQYV